MTTAVAQETSGLTLVSPQFFQRLSNRVAEKHNLKIGLAQRITDQTLAYLATCAQDESGKSFAMAPMVDLGWHVFLEYTRQYDLFFSSHGWDKQHHDPYDVPGQEYEGSETALPKTVAAIKAAGYRVDHELWAGNANCGQGGAPKSCGSDGGGGNPPDCGHSV